MKGTRIYGVVAFVSLIGIVVGGGLLHFLRDGTDISDAASRAERNKRDVLDGLADGRILYLKNEDYRKTRILPGTDHPPERVIIEYWLQSETAEGGELGLATERNVEGRLLQYSVVKDDILTTTFVSSGETLETHWTRPSPSDWIKMTWQWAGRLASDPDIAFRGTGEMNGRATLIYEALSDLSRTRWELVPDAPLLRRDSTFRIDGQGKETLTEETNVVEYRLLPAGSRVPQPPDFQ